MGENGARPHSCSAWSPFRKYFCCLAIKERAETEKRKRAQFRNAPSLVLSVRSEMGHPANGAFAAPDKKATRLQVSAYTHPHSLRCVSNRSVIERSCLTQLPGGRWSSRLTDLFPLVLCVLSPCALLTLRSCAAPRLTRYPHPALSGLVAETRLFSPQLQFHFFILTSKKKKLNGTEPNRLMQKEQG